MNRIRKRAPVGGANIKKIQKTVFNSGFQAIPHVEGIDQWFPTTAPGTTSAPQAVLKCSPKNLKSTIH